MFVAARGRAGTKDLQKQVQLNEGSCKKQTTKTSGAGEALQNSHRCIQGQHYYCQL